LAHIYGWLPVGGVGRTSRIGTQPKDQTCARHIDNLRTSSTVAADPDTRDTPRGLWARFDAHPALSRLGRDGDPACSTGLPGYPLNSP